MVLLAANAEGRLAAARVSTDASRQVQWLHASTTSRLSWSSGQKTGRPSACPAQGLQGCGQPLHSSVSMKTKSTRAPRLSPRMRVLCGDDIALGPGKVD